MCILQAAHLESVVVGGIDSLAGEYGGKVHLSPVQLQNSREESSL